jgi:ribose transport system permease protein
MTVEPLAHAPSRSRERLLPLASRLLAAGPLITLGLLIAVLSILSPVFLTLQNFQNVGSATAFIAIIAAGQFVVILVRGLDLSVGAVVALSAVVAAAVAGLDAWLGMIVVAILTGLCVGFANGVIVVKGRISNPIIVTVATLGVIRGVALLVSNGEVEVGVPPEIRWLGGGFIGPIPVPVAVAAAVAVLLFVATRGTRWGQWLYAVGGNPEGARRVGISTGRVTISGFMVCSGLAALAGLLVAGRTNAVDPTAGALAELDAITAVVIGGASLAGGRGSVINVVIGALILGFIRNGLNLLAVSSFYQLILIGLLVLLALEIDVLRRIVDERLRVRQAGESGA